MKRQKQLGSRLTAAMRSPRLRKKSQVMGPDSSLLDADRTAIDSNSENHALCDIAMPAAVDNGAVRTWSTTGTLENDRPRPAVMTSCYRQGHSDLREQSVTFDANVPPWYENDTITFDPFDDVDSDVDCEVPDNLPMRSTADTEHHFSTLALPDEFVRSGTPHTDGALKPLARARRSSDGSILVGDLTQAAQKLTALSHVHQSGTCSQFNSPRHRNSASPRSSPTVQGVLQGSRRCNSNSSCDARTQSSENALVPPATIKVVLKAPSSESLEESDAASNCENFDGGNGGRLGVDVENQRTFNGIISHCSSPALITSPRKYSVPNGACLFKDRNSEFYSSLEKSRSLPRHAGSSPPLGSGRPRRIVSTSVESPRYEKQASSRSSISPTGVRKKSCAFLNSDSKGPSEAKQSVPGANRSPVLVHARRASRGSPYRGLESQTSSSSDSDHSFSGEVITHLPPKSPLPTAKTFGGVDTVDSHFPDVRSNKTQRKVVTRSSAVRKQKSASRWKPVDDMIANQYYAGHYCGDIEDESAGRCDVDGNGLQRMKSYDAVLFDVLKVPAEAFARQLTLLDFPIFRKIQPDEITSCGWNKKAKKKLSPNVVAMTQRFNHTSFWVIREILNSSTLKIRAEVLTHFIKIAKKLYDLNNLHSLMAVIQSLNSSSIFRLTRTWALVQKHHRASFDRLLSLVKEDDNRWELRSHMGAIKLPCIPFLGMYLSDVMYIDTAHPDTGGLESHERTNKMNNVLRIIAEFQQSNYSHLQEELHIKNYLNSVNYIEELQKFLEEDNYKLSLKIEPSQTPGQRRTPERKVANTKDDMSTGKGTGKNDSQLSRHISHTPPTQQRFVPGHRKSRSLGKEFAFTGAASARAKSENAKIHKRRSTIAGRKRDRDHTVWYLTPAARFLSNRALSSGSLPRNTASPSNSLSVTTSLLDDSIIAMPSSLASSSSSTTRMSVTCGGNNSSIGSSRSNSGSEYSEQDEMSWSADRSTFRRKLRRELPVRWEKIPCGRHGKYKMRPVVNEQARSSTYPVSMAQKHQKSWKEYRGAGPWLGSSSSSRDLDEFVRMRCRREQVEVVARLSELEVDDEEATLLPSPDGCQARVSRQQRARQGSKDAYEPISRVKQAISHLILSDGLRATTGEKPANEKLFRQHFVSPKTTLVRQGQARAARSSVSVTRPAKIGGPAKSADNLSREWNRSSSDGTCDVSIEFQQCDFEGVLRRKCVRKNGKKPAMAGWTKYWVSLCGSQLVYYPAKTLRATLRNHFKARPSKAVTIKGWMLLHSDDPTRLDLFQLTNPNLGNTYRFQCESGDVALVWLNYLKTAVKENTKNAREPEKDLINLEDT